MKKQLIALLVAVIAVMLAGIGVARHFKTARDTRITDGSVADAGNYNEPSGETVFSALTTLLTETAQEGTTSALAPEMTDGTLPPSTSSAPETTTKKSWFSKKETTTQAAKTTAAPNAATAAPSAAKTTAASTTQKAVPAGAKGKQVLDYEYAYAGYQPYYADMSVPWNLILVNRDYILPDDFEVQLASIRSYDDNPQKMDYRAAPHYNEMFDAAAEEGIYLYAISGYRSVTRQRNNFERKIQYYRDQGYSKVEATQMAARIILPPGTSEHNAGLAVDILSLEQSFENTKAFRWLNAHAHEYGFILRYPKDKEDVTKIIYEPWHYRYVGVETAKAVKASGLCYEEYLGMA